MRDFLIWFGENSAPLDRTGGKITSRCWMGEREQGASRGYFIWGGGKGSERWRSHSRPRRRAGSGGMCLEEPCVEISLWVCVREIAVDKEKGGYECKVHLELFRHTPLFTHISRLKITAFLSDIITLLLRCLDTLISVIIHSFQPGNNWTVQMRRMAARQGDGSRSLRDFMDPFSRSMVNEAVQIIFTHMLSFSVSLNSLCVSFTASESKL